MKSRANRQPTISVDIFLFVFRISSVGNQLVNPPDKKGEKKSKQMKKYMQLELDPIHPVSSNGVVTL